MNIDAITFGLIFGSIAFGIYKFYHRAVGCYRLYVNYVEGIYFIFIERAIIDRARYELLVNNMKPLPVMILQFWKNESKQMFYDEKMYNEAVEVINNEYQKYIKEQMGMI